HLEVVHLSRFLAEIDDERLEVGGLGGRLGAFAAGRLVRRGLGWFGGLASGGERGPGDCPPRRAGGGGGHPPGDHPAPAVSFWVPLGLRLRTSLPVPLGMLPVFIRRISA